MHERTPGLARRLRRARSTAAEVEVLADAYAGEPCVVLSAGPSLAGVDQVALRTALDGVLTLVVKQTIEVAGPQADFLCFNAFNVRRYRAPSPDTVWVYARGVDHGRHQFNRRDLTLDYARAVAPSQAVAASGRFEEHLLSTRLERPWGPGIMYELVVYLAVHLGVSSILTLGWDIADAAGHNTHFDESATSRAPRAASPPPSDFWTSAEPTVPGRLPLAHRLRGLVGSYRRHRAGLPYNRTPMAPGEPALVGRSTALLSEWLRSHDVRLSVVTDSPWFDPAVDVVPVADFDPLMIGSRT